jgi:hypothetical protein
MSYIPDINSYADARKHFDSVKPWRGSTDRPLGNRRHSNKRMRMTDDGSIEMEYQSHTFIVYRPDGTVDAQAYDGNVQTNIVRQAIPKGIELQNVEVRLKPTIALAPVAQVKDGYSWYNSFPHWIPKNGPWKDPYPEWGNRKVNPDVLVLQSANPVKLNYYADKDMWLPIDESKLVPFEWDEIDKSASRKLNEEYKLGHFEAWVNAQIKLLEGHGEREWPMYEAVEDDVLLDLIKAGDFEKAVTHFPRGDKYWTYSMNWWTQYGQHQGRQHPGLLPPALHHIQHLRTLLYKREGILRHRSERIVSLPEYGRIKHLLYRFS